MLPTKTSAEVGELFFFKLGRLWQQFKQESLAFKFICGYLFVEYFRPQTIYPALDILPWAQFFLGGALMFTVMDKQARLAFSAVHFWMLMWVIVIYSSFLVAFNVSWSLDKQIFFIQWVIVFFIISMLVTTRARFYLFFMVFMICGFKIALGTTRIWVMRGFSFTTWGLAGPSGYFQNSGELAILMLTLLPISYYLWAAHRHSLPRFEKLFLTLSMICPFLTIIGSSSRGGQLAMLVQLGIMFHRQIFKPKIMVSVAIIGALGFAVLPDEQKERFSGIGTDKTSQQRILYWENGWEMIKDHPVLGVGYYNFIPYYNTYYSEDIVDRRKSAELPHNIFIQVGTDAGFLGLFVFVILICLSLFKRLPDKDRYPIEYSIMRGLRMGTLGFLIAGQFVTVTYYPFLWMNLALQCAISVACQSKPVLPRMNQRRAAIEDTADDEQQA